MNLRFCAVGLGKRCQGIPHISQKRDAGHHTLTIQKGKHMTVAGVREAVNVGGE